MIGKKIKERREELHLSQEQLAQKIGVGKTAISNYEQNISSPKESVLLKLFEALQCDANYLYEDYIRVSEDFQVSGAEKKAIQKYRVLDTHGKDMVSMVLDKEYSRCTKMEKQKQQIQRPTLNLRHSFYKVSAGTGFMLDGNAPWKTISVPDTPETRRADFALTIQGDSMEPIYFDGDIVLVEQTSAIDVGEVGIFILDDAGYIKKFGGDRLISLNDQYDDILLNHYDYIKCCGRVIGRV